LQIERGRAATDAPRGIVMGAVTGAEPAVPVSDRVALPLAERYTAEMRADPDDDQPLLPHHAVAVGLGVDQLIQIDRAGLGIPELDEMVARYCAATGRDGVPDMNWYFAYNFFRLAGIIQGIKKRVIEGTASSQHAKDMSERVRPLAERAWDFARKAGA